jgi:hypothetical protein
MAWLSTHVAEHTTRPSRRHRLLSVAPGGPTGGVRDRERPAGPALPGNVGALARCWCTARARSHRGHGGASPWLKDIVEVCDYFRVTLRIVPEDLVF